MKNESTRTCYAVAEFTEVGAADLRSVEGGFVANVIAWLGNKARDYLVAKVCEEMYPACEPPLEPIT